MENKKVIKSVRKLKGNSHFVKEAKSIIYPQYVVKNGMDGLAHIEHVTHIGMEIAERECSDTDTDLYRLSLYRFKGREIDLNRLSTEAAKELLEYSKKYIAFRMKDYEIDFEAGDNFER